MLISGAAGSAAQPAPAAAPVEVSALRAGEEADWDRFVMTNPSATFFHRHGWGRVVAETLGHETTYLAARRGGRLTGVFPFSRVRNKIFGDCLVSLPLAVYGGVCADDEESYRKLLTAAQAMSDGFGVKYLEMRNEAEPYATELPGRDLYVTFTLDLTPGPDKLLAAMPRDTRYMIRKSLKAGLDWTEDLSVDEFYEIYAESVHRLGTPVFSKRLFTSLREQFPAESRLFGVRKAGRAIAGVFCLYHRDRVMPYYGGALAEFNKDAPNNFMYWNLIAQSSQEGYRCYDFGRSKKGTGSCHFKSGWSMTVTELPYRYHLSRAKAVPALSPVDAKFQLPVALWKRLPFAWTKILGPRLIRWVPSV